MYVYHAVPAKLKCIWHQIAYLIISKMDVFVQDDCRVATYN